MVTIAVREVSLKVLHGLDDDIPSLLKVSWLNFMGKELSLILSTTRTKGPERYIPGLSNSVVDSSNEGEV